MTPNLKEAAVMFHQRQNEDIGNIDEVTPMLIDGVKNLIQLHLVVIIMSFLA